MAPISWSDWQAWSVKSKIVAARFSAPSRRSNFRLADNLIYVVDTTSHRVLATKRSQIEHLNTVPQKRSPAPLGIAPILTRDVHPIIDIPGRRPVAAE